MYSSRFTPADERALWDVEDPIDEPDTPFGAPEDLRSSRYLDDTHQLADGELDSHEQYDAGLEAASGADPPSQLQGELWLV